MKITVKLNGKSRTFVCPPDERVVDLLRRHGILSVHKGCDGEGMCGACAILLDGRLVNSCLLLAPQINGREIVTVEGLAPGRQLHPIQQAFIDSGVVQCGYCTPAMVLAAKELLDRHPHPTRAQVQDFLSGIYCRCTGYEQLFEAITLASERLQGKSATASIPSYREDLRVVGKASPKIDAKKLLSGQPAFVEDQPAPGTLIIKVLTSPHAHAHIKKIDTKKAVALDGVVAVYTHHNVPQRFYNAAGQGYPEPSPYDRRLIDEYVRFVGDRVAIVAAESEAIAQQALDLIKVEYEPLPALLTLEEAMAPGAYPIHRRDLKLDPLPIGADPASNLAASSSGGIGDLEQGFAQAAVTIEREYHTGRVHASPLEPHICYTYIQDDRLIMHASIQVPWHLRRIVASLLGIRENQIRVIKERVGGGFGVKQDIVVEDIAAWVTWQTGRPALIRLTREEEFVTTRTRHPMKIKLKLGAREDGELTAMQMTLLADTGAYGPHCLTVPMNACSKSLPILRCPNVQFEVRSYYTNNPIAGAYQGYGAPQGTFAVQMAMAELAQALNMDLTRLLEKNMVRTGDELEILKCLGEGQEGIVQKVSSCGLPECLRQGRQAIGWGQPVESLEEHIKIGKGVAIIQQGSGLPGIDSANAEIKMFSDGTFMVLMGGTDLGTGLDTLAVKLAAEVLCVDVEAITILAADTDLTPFDVGAYASSGTYFSGGAVYKAAQALRSKIIALGAQMLQTAPEQVQLSYPGKVVGPGGEVDYLQIARQALSGKGPGQLMASASFTTDRSPIPYGAHFVQVAVNTQTGAVTVQRYLAFQDCGTPINPALALGQVYGGIMKAVGHSLYEELQFDEHGRCCNPNFLDYKVPMIKDLPEEVQAHLVYVEEALGPFGAKSVSEISTNGAAPAIAAAIHDATGVWLREWPFTAEKVLQALEAAQDASASA